MRQIYVEIVVADKEWDENDEPHMAKVYSKRVVITPAELTTILPHEQAILFQVQKVIREIEQIMEANNA